MTVIYHKYNYKSIILQDYISVPARYTIVILIMNQTEQVHVIPAEMHIEFLDPAVNKGASVARLCTE